MFYVSYISIRLFENKFSHLASGSERLGLWVLGWGKGKGAPMNSGFLM